MSSGSDASTSARRGVRSAARSWGAAVFLAWTLLAVASIAQLAVSYRQRGEPVPWSLVVPDRLIDWYTCAVFTPVCVWLVRRYPLDARPYATLSVYLAVTGMCVVLKCLLLAAIMQLMHGEAGVSFSRILLQGVLFDLVALWGVTAVAHALELQRRLSQREQDAFALRAQLSEAELVVLKGQLQPHFLFNALNAIASLIHTAPATADAMLVHLSDLLRTSLRFGGVREVPLAHELTLLEQYLAIMTARFAEQLIVERRIDPAARQALVPQFLLQPIVENAIEHGIGPSGRTGRVHIDIGVVNETQLRIEITDNGDASGVTVANPDRVGLGNTRKRLHLLYGVDHLLQLTQRPEGGMRVTIVMPLRTA